LLTGLLSLSLWPTIFSGILPLRL